MEKKAKDRIFRYLVRTYSLLSETQQKEKLGIIMDRLKKYDLWEEDLLNEIVDAIQEENGSMPWLLATLDMLDIHERT